MQPHTRALPRGEIGGHSLFSFGASFRAKRFLAPTTEQGCKPDPRGLRFGFVPRALAQVRGATEQKPRQ